MSQRRQHYKIVQEREKSSRTLREHTLGKEDAPGTNGVEALTSLLQNEVQMVPGMSDDMLSLQPKDVPGSDDSSVDQNELLAEAGTRNTAAGSRKQTSERVDLDSGMTSLLRKKFSGFPFLFKESLFSNLAVILLPIRV